MTKKELENIDNYKYERALREKGVKLIAGVDEVGRGESTEYFSLCCGDASLSGNMSSVGWEFSVTLF